MRYKKTEYFVWENDNFKRKHKTLHNALIHYASLPEGDRSLHKFIDSNRKSCYIPLMNDMNGLTIMVNRKGRGIIKNRHLDRYGI